MPPNHWPRILSVLTAVSCLAVTACDPTPEEDEHFPREETAEIVANLQDAGYPRADIAVGPEGRVVLQGDMVVSVGASRSLAPRNFRHYRAHDIVSKSIDTIIVWVHPGLHSKPEFALAVENAMQQWNEVGASIGFSFQSSYLPEPPNYDADPEVAVIQLQPNNGHYNAEADFPRGDGLPGPIIDVNVPHMDARGYTLSAKVRVLMHEIGHTMGLVHTDWLTQSSCIGSPGPVDPQEGGGPSKIEGTPDVDPNSVMNSCTNATAIGQWSCADKAAIERLYR